MSAAAPPSGPLHIGVAVEDFPALSETFVLNQVTGLLDRGHDVTVLAFHRRGADEAQPDVARYGLLERVRYRARIPGSPLRRRRRALALAGQLAARAPRDALRLLRHWPALRARRRWEGLYTAALWLAGPEPDVLHCHFGTVGERFAELAALGLLRCPLLVTFHGRDIRLAEREGPGCYSHLRRRADRVLAISEWSRAQLERAGFEAERIERQPVGIDWSRFAAAGGGRAERSGEPLRALTVARLVEDKDLATGLAAVRHCLDAPSGPRLEYWILGGGPLEGELRRRASALGLDGAVHWLGAGGQEDVLRALGACDVYLSPSRAEALPVSVMEACAAGLPVVATRVGGVEEIVEDGASGFLVPAGDARALAARLLELAGSPERRRQMGARGSARVRERFDVEPLNDRLVALYRALCAERGAGERGD